MKRPIKIIVILIVAILVISSVYVVFYLNNNESGDTIPPTIDSITGNTSGSTGKNGHGKCYSNECTINCGIRCRTELVGSTLITIHNCW